MPPGKADEILKFTGVTSSGILEICCLGYGAEASLLTVSATWDLLPTQKRLSESVLPLQVIYLFIHLLQRLGLSVC